MFCEECGGEIHADGMFCTECGKRLKKIETPNGTSDFIVTLFQEVKKKLGFDIHTPSENTISSNQSSNGDLIVGITATAIILIFLAIILDQLTKSPSDDVTTNSTATYTTEQEQISEANSVRELSPLEKLAQMESVDISPYGELAEMFNYGSDFTNLQREIKFNEIYGKVVSWQLPVYDIKRSSSGYTIQTNTSTGKGVFGALSGDMVVGTFIKISPRDEADRRFIESLKTGDIVSFKGVIKDTSMRNLEIEPAILENRAANSSDVDNTASVKNPIEPKAISDNFSPEDMSKLLAALNNKLQNCIENSPCQLDGFELEPIDLEEDGNSEFLVTKHGYCGVGGCTTLLIKKSNDKNWGVLMGHFGVMKVNDSMSTGVHDIDLITKCYRNNGWESLTVTFTWSGESYMPKDKSATICSMQETLDNLFKDN